MSYADGWAAMNLEMPARIPRSEFDAQTHWELVKRVTGIEVTYQSPPEVRERASQAFMRAWNYDLFLGGTIYWEIFDGFCTNMGHAEYVAEKYGKTHVIIGNADTRILLMGSKAEIRAEVERCLSIGRHCPGYFMGVTNMIPANTPVDSALYYNEVYEELSRR